MNIDGEEYDSLTRSYTFQGYQIYQLADNTVSAADLANVEMARLIYQCDVADDIDVPRVCVEAAESDEEA